MSQSRSAAAAHLDPYRLDPEDILEPPVGLGNILRKIGPGIVLAASIVGGMSFSLVFTLLLLPCMLRIGRAKQAQQTIAPETAQRAALESVA